jgi:hypothetical protein
MKIKEFTKKKSIREGHPKREYKVDHFPNGFCGQRVRLGLRVSVEWKVDKKGVN